MLALTKNSMYSLSPRLLIRSSPDCPSKKKKNPCGQLWFLGFKNLLFEETTEYSRL